MTRKIFWVTLLVVVLAVPACNDEQIAKMRAKVGLLEKQVPIAEETLAVAREQSANIEAIIQSLPDGDIKDKLLKAKLITDQTLKVASDFLEKAEPELAKLNAALAEATDTLDVVDAGIKSVTPFMPLPWGAVLAAGGGLVIAVLRAAKTRKAARGIVKSVQPFMGNINLTDKQKAAIRMAQGAMGNRIVDEAQGKKTALLI